MRHVVLQMSITLDGYVAGPGGGGDWGLPAEHPDVRAWKLASLGKAGTHIMGRVTYGEMAGYWPNATGDYADVMNKLPADQDHGMTTWADFRPASISGTRL